MAFLLFSWLTAKTLEAVNTFTAPGVLLQTLGTSFFGLSIGLVSNADYDSEGGLWMM